MEIIDKQKITNGMIFCFLLLGMFITENETINKPIQLTISSNISMLVV